MQSDITMTYDRDGLSGKIEYSVQAIGDGAVAVAIAENFDPRYATIFPLGFMHESDGTTEVTMLRTVGSEPLADRDGNVIRSSSIVEAIRTWEKTWAGDPA